MPFLAQEHFDIPTKDLLSWMFDDLKYDWDTAIYLDALQPSNSISARQARTLIRKLVAGLRATGVQKGDCVLLNSANDIHIPICFLGTNATGAVYTACNPAHTPYELAHTLKIAKVKYIITQPNLLDNVLKAAELQGLSKDHVLIFNPNGEEAPRGFRTWSDLLQHGEDDWIRFDDLNTCRNTPAARLFSSGTTGLPKAIDLSHYNFIAQHTLVHEAYPRPWRSRRLFAMPMFHAAIAPVAFTSCLRSGMLGVVMPRFEPETWFWAHQEYQITDMNSVPPIVVMAINHPARHKYSLKSVVSGNCGGAPLDKLPQIRIQQLLADNAQYTQAWGMTESSCIATRFAWPEQDSTGSIGRPLPNLDIKLVDDDGKDISGYDVLGEICIRGPTVVSGYFENPEANARDWDDEGYFHTGDVVYVDGKTKKWYIADRKKELIKVRGFQVAPGELEGVLLDHPDIVDVAVIGVPDSKNPESSEAPRAYIQRGPDSGDKPSAEEVHKFVKERLSSYKQLVGGIVFVDSIPKSPNGKILKRILRERAKKELASKL